MAARGHIKTVRRDFGWAARHHISVHTPEGVFFFCLLRRLYFPVLFWYNGKNGKEDGCMEPAVSAKKRFAHIDLLKCIAMYLVLMFHGTLYPNVVFPDMPLNMLLRYFSRTILSACVPLFFFAGGYLLLSRPMDLKKHTIRTLKFLVLTCFWTVFLRVILQPYYQEFCSWEELKADLWTLKSGWNNQLWYLETLIGIYLVFPLLKGAFDGNRGAFYWFTAVMAVLVFGRDTTDLGVTLYNLLVKKEFWLYYSDLPVFNQYNPFAFLPAMGIAYFCLGGVAWAMEERLLRIPVRWRNLGACSGILLCCFMLGMIGWRFSLYLKGLWDVVWNGYDTVFTLGNVLCLYVLSLNLKRDIPLLRLISANTLGIYLLHDLLHKAAGPLAVQLPFLCTLPGTMLYTAVLLMATLGVCLILKKLPLVKHLIS